MSPILKHTPLYCLPLLISIFSIGLSQVAPSYQPYSLMHPDIELPATQLTAGALGCMADSWELPGKDQLRKSISIVEDNTGEYV
jgi:hypothetical protein